MTISEIISSTHCPYAKKATLAADIITVKSLDLASELKSIRSIISQFFKSAKHLQLDALCIQFTHLEFGNSLENLAKNTKNFFKAIEREFPEFLLPVEIPDFDEPFWPCIEGERFFMVSFAPCYPANSPRYNFGDPSTYFFLQPVTSFERHAADSDAITLHTRQKIRDLFSKNNQPYDGTLSNFKQELVKMVPPLRVGDPLVEWWKP